jgi:protein kinase C-binding protein NELL
LFRYENLLHLKLHKFYLNCNFNLNSIFFQFITKIGTCVDINECLERGGDNGHHCNSNTKCVNVYGSYICECLDGYTRSDKWNCIEINECTTGQHECDKNAICTNTPGSFTCTCKEGFTGDGKSCVPVCEPRCLNGGKCIAPNTCECRGGYEGSSCEKDLDECKTNKHGCTEDTSICVNMPGW